jgi:hypothetical protein
MNRHGHCTVRRRKGAAMRQLHLGLVIGLLLGALSWPALAAKYTKRERAEKSDGVMRDLRLRMTSRLARVHKGFESYVFRQVEQARALVKKIKEAKSAYLNHGIPGLQPLLIEGHSLGARPFRDIYRESKSDGVRYLRLSGSLMPTRPSWLKLK